MVRDDYHGVALYNRKADIIDPKLKFFLADIDKDGDIYTENLRIEQIEKILNRRHFAK